MDITREAMVERMASLEKELGDILDRSNAISGAIQDCRYWIAWLDKEEIEQNKKEDLAGG